MARSRSTASFKPRVAGTDPGQEINKGAWDGVPKGSVLNGSTGGETLGVLPVGTSSMAVMAMT